MMHNLTFTKTIDIANYSLDYISKFIWFKAWEIVKTKGTAKLRTKPKSASVHLHFNNLL